jgi:hypothetical protein
VLCGQLLLWKSQLEVGYWLVSDCAASSRCNKFIRKLTLIERTSVCPSMLQKTPTTCGAMVKVQLIRYWCTVPPESHGHSWEHLTSEKAIIYGWRHGERLSVGFWHDRFDVCVNDLSRHLGLTAATRLRCGSLLCHSEIVQSKVSRTEYFR